MRIIGNDPSTPRQAQIVASGTLSTGDTVVVNADGTVSVVEETDVSQGLGSEVVFIPNRPDFSNMGFDVSANRVVVAYKDLGNNEYGTAVVGTISGTSISFGTPVVFRSGSCAYMSVTYDSVAEKTVISFEDADVPGGEGCSIVGTVSGTSISFGSKATFESGTIRHISTAFDTTAGKIVLIYVTGSFFYGRTATVSGTSISFGSQIEIDQSSDQYRSTGIAYDPIQNKTLCLGCDLGNGTRPKAFVATVSGTSISFGSEVTVETASASSVEAVFDASISRILVATNASSKGSTRIATISGTSVSFSSASTFNSSSVSEISMVYDSNAEKTVVTYQDQGSYYRARLNVGTASASSVSYGTQVVVQTVTGTANSIATAFDSTSNKVAISYYNNTSTDAISLVFQNASTDINLTAENYIGTAATGAPDGTGAKINLKGAVDENQSGLTAGQSYYVQTDGTLGTTPADPSVFAGTAVAANKLIVKG